MKCRSRIMQIISPIIILLFGILIFYQWTLGFTAFTTYSYTLESAGPLPRPLPTFHLIGQRNDRYTTDKYKGKYLLLTFVYFHCPFVCPIILGKYIQLHEKLLPFIKKSQLTLLSLSVDPEKDTPTSLTKIWDNYQQPQGWDLASLATPINPQMHNKLSRFGVWVYKRPGGMGMFNHSSYIFLISPKGQLIHVFQPEESAKKISKQVINIIAPPSKKVKQEEN